MKIKNIFFVVGILLIPISVFAYSFTIDIPNLPDKDSIIEKIPDFRKNINFPFGDDEENVQPNDIAFIQYTETERIYALTRDGNVYYADLDSYPYWKKGHTQFKVPVETDKIKSWSKWSFVDIDGNVWMLSFGNRWINIGKPPLK